MNNLIRITALIKGVAFILLALSITSVRSATLAFDNFEEYSVGVSLNGLNGGTGWGNAWTANASGVSVIISDHLLTYTSTDGFIYGGGASIAVSGGNSIAAAFRDISFTVSDGSDVYASMLFQVTRQDGATGTMIDNPFTSWSPRDGAFDAAVDNSLVIGGNARARARVNNQTISVTTPLQYNTTYLVVVCFSGWDDGSYKTTTTWLNPSIDDLNSGNAAIRATITQTAGGSTLFDGLQLRTNALGVGSEAHTFYFDDIRIGTDWMDVVPIPEPSTGTQLFTIFAAGAVVLWRRHRHSSSIA